MELIEVYIGPASAGPSSDALASGGATAVDVPNSGTAWLTSTTSPSSTRIIAVADGNTIIVLARFLDQETIIALTGALIEHLDATSR